MPNHNRGQLAKAWFAQARCDYKSADVVLREGGYYGTTCYLSQQIAEKYLKGFLVYHGRTLVKIHDLVKLLNDCRKIDKDFSKLEEECVLLNEYYIESRYPVDMPVNYTKQEAKEALKAAEKIMDFVTGRI